MKKAKIYLAGSIFDRLTSSVELTEFYGYLRNYLTNNELKAPAPAVYLSRDRFARSPLFLESGFDVIPADEEPFQIALSALFDSTLSDPPDEYLLGFAPGKIPSRFLEKLAGLGKRTLLVSGAEPADSYESALDVSAYLAGSGRIPAEPKPDQPKSAPKPDVKPMVIIPLAPKEPTPPQYTQMRTPAPKSVPQPAPKLDPIPASPVSTPQPISEHAPVKTAASSAAPSKPETPAVSEKPAERLNVSNLVAKKDEESAGIEVKVEDCVKVLLEAFEEKRSSVPLSELTATIRTNVPGMENLTNDAVVKSHILDDLVRLDKQGNLTVQRSDRPELQKIPAEVGVWLLENDRLLNSELNEMVSGQSGTASLSEEELASLSDEVKARHPILKNLVSESWLESRLSRLNPIVIRVDSSQKTTLDPDFDNASKRAALMKEYTQWLVRKKDGTPESEKKQNEFANRAAHLFVNLEAIPASLSDEQITLLADCYESVEVGARMLDACLNDKLSQQASQQLIGQCCADSICMLKSALIDLGIDLHADGVQICAYGELRKFANQNGVFLQNMKKESRIDPANHRDFKSHLIDQEKKFTRQDISKRKKSVLNRLDYHINKIKEDLPGSVHDWNVVVDQITELVKECGVIWTSDEIKNRLRPFIGKIPEEVDMTDTFIRIVQHIEIQSDPDALRKPSRTSPKDQKLSPAVRKVRKAYKGTKLVFIGGTPQPHIEERLKEKFQLEDVLWEETSHGDSLNRFRSVLNDELVRLITVYIPWCSHKHSLEFSKDAKDAGKDFVRIRKGTNPETIAAAICEQIGLK